MQMKKLFVPVVAAVTLIASTFVLMTPADAWCRFGRCGWGPRVFGPRVVVGVPGPYYYARPRGYYVCPRGFHWAADGDGCIENR